MPALRLFSYLLVALFLIANLVLFYEYYIFYFHFKSTSAAAMLGGDLNIQPLRR
jgi:hypothetical protein